MLLLNTQLEQHASCVETPHFTSPGLQLRELAPSFERIESKRSLVKVFREIITFAASGRERAALVSFTLPHLLRFCPTPYKKHLLHVTLKEQSKLLRKRLAYGIVRSATSRQELFELLSAPTAYKLVECGSRKLTELVAKTQVLKMLEGVTPPAAMTQRSFKENNAKNRSVARTRVRELENAARKGLTLLEKLSYLSHKPRSKTEVRPLIPARPLHDARMTLSTIARTAEKLRTGPRPTYGRMKEFIHSATRRLALERSDGIRLLQSHTLPDKDLWKPNLVKRFVEAYHLIPESDRLMTPNLREFILSKSENAAERRTCGRIALNYPGELFTWRDTRYEGRSALTRLVLHEVAHSIQMGHQGKMLQWDPATGELFSPNNPLIDLKGFFQISGWRVVGWFETPAFISHHGVRINGKLYPLGRPVTISLPLRGSDTITPSPQRVVLRRGAGNLLYCHDVDARFSLNNYALTEPSEDWAESFTEYVMCPDRLIDLAPEKFHYMEVHFRLYRTARDLPRLSAAERALRHTRLGMIDSPRSQELLTP